MSQVTWRAPDELVERVRQVAARGEEVIDDHGTPCYTETPTEVPDAGNPYVRLRRNDSMHIRFLVAAFGLFVGGGCSSDAPSNPDGNDDLTDVFVFSSNDQCRAPLRSGAAAGDTCTLPDDCAEVCCDCDTRMRSFSARACVAGKCSTEVSTCAHAEETTTICLNPIILGY